MLRSLRTALAKFVLKGAEQHARLAIFLGEEDKEQALRGAYRLRDGGLHPYHFGRTHLAEGGGDESVERYVEIGVAIANGYAEKVGTEVRLTDAGRLAIQEAQGRGDLPNVAT